MKPVNISNTSTTSNPNFNFYTVLFTAFVFFLILSFYTFFLSLFGYFIIDLDGKNREHKGSDVDAVVGTFVFLMIWLAFVIILFMYLTKHNLLHI